MQTSKCIHVVSCHAEGEVGDVIVGGVAAPPGTTLWEQSRFIHQDGTLRNFLLNEPRGGLFRHVNLLVPPKNPAADYAWIIMEPEDTPPMSGSNSICVATVLLETGIAPMSEPETQLTLEAPGGLVRVTANCRDGRVEKVTVASVPSFVVSLGIDLEVRGIGTLKVDTGFGGDSFVMVEATKLGFDIATDEARELAEIGVQITDAANEQLGFAHPTIPDWKHISFCQIYRQLESENGAILIRNAVSIKPGKIDRSPTGTGVCARMAALHASGKMGISDRYIGESIIGSRFHGRILHTTRVGEVAAIQPEFSGRAWITGIHQHQLDPRDPWPSGYRVSDTWPMERTKAR